MQPSLLASSRTMRASTHSCTVSSLGEAKAHAPKAAAASSAASAAPPVGAKVRTKFVPIDWRGTSKSAEASPAVSPAKAAFKKLLAAAAPAASASLNSPPKAASRGVEKAARRGSVDVSLSHAAVAAADVEPAHVAQHEADLAMSDADRADPTDAADLTVVADLTDVAHPTDVADPTDEADSTDAAEPTDVTDLTDLTDAAVVAAVAGRLDLVEGIDAEAPAADVEGSDTESPRVLSRRRVGLARPHHSCLPPREHSDVPAAAAAPTREPSPAFDLTGSPDAPSVGREDAELLQPSPAAAVASPDLDAPMASPEAAADDHMLVESFSPPAAPTILTRHASTPAPRAAAALVPPLAARAPAAAHPLKKSAAVGDLAAAAPTAWSASTSTPERARLAVKKRAADALVAEADDTGVSFRGAAAAPAAGGPKAAGRSFQSSLSLSAKKARFAESRQELIVVLVGDQTGSSTDHGVTQRLVVVCKAPDALEPPVILMAYGPDLCARYKTGIRASATQVVEFTTQAQAEVPTHKGLAFPGLVKASYLRSLTGMRLVPTEQALVAPHGPQSIEAYCARIGALRGSMAGAWVNIRGLIVARELVQLNNADGMKLTVLDESGVACVVSIFDRPARVSPMHLFYALGLSAYRAAADQHLEFTVHSGTVYRVERDATCPTAACEAASAVPLALRQLAAQGLAKLKEIAKLSNLSLPPVLEQMTLDGLRERALARGVAAKAAENAAHEAGSVVPFAEPWVFGSVLLQSGSVREMAPYYNGCAHASDRGASFGLCRTAVEEVMHNERTVVVHTNHAKGPYYHEMEDSVLCYRLHVECHEPTAAELGQQHHSNPLFASDEGYYKKVLRAAVALEQRQSVASRSSSSGHSRASSAASSASASASGSASAASSSSSSALHSDAEGEGEGEGSGAADDEAVDYSPLVSLTLFDSEVTAALQGLTAQAFSEQPVQSKRDRLAAFAARAFEYRVKMGEDGAVIEAKFVPPVAPNHAP